MIAVSSPHRGRGLRRLPLRHRHAQGDGAGLEEGVLRGRRGVGGTAVASVTTATSLRRSRPRHHSPSRDAPGGETVLVAVSGGADSVALLDVLRALRAGARPHAPRRPRRITVSAPRPTRDADVRPAASASAWACPATSSASTVRPGAALGRARGGGAPRPLRRLRARGAARVGAARIATGHTADDQAETVLMRLLEGAGPRGLGGIAPVRGLLIRPLHRDAPAPRSRRTCAARGLAWVEDAEQPRPALPAQPHPPRRAAVPGASSSAPGWWSALGRSAARGARGGGRSRARRRARPRAPRPRAGPAAGASTSPPSRALPERAGRRDAAPGRRGPRATARPLRGPAQRALRRLLGAAPRRRGALGSGGVTRASAAAAGCAWGRRRCPRSRARAWPVPGALDAARDRPRLDARCFARARGLRGPARARPRRLRRRRAAGRAHGARAARAATVFAPFGGPRERRLKSFLIDAGVPALGARRASRSLEAGGEIIWVAGLRRGPRRAGRPRDTRVSSR